MSHDRARWIIALLLTALVLTTSNIAVSAAAVVYDNTTTPVTGPWTADTEKGFWPFSVFGAYEDMGDEITLAGTARTITEFELILLSPWQEVILSSTATEPSLALTFWKNDGLDVYGFPGAPGTWLWEGSISSDITLPVNVPTTVTFSVPDVVVPDTFTWTTRADSLSAGMAIYDPPTFGSSGDHYWDLYAGDWYPMSFGGGPVANFGARVTAVPEPSALAVLILGGLSAVRRRRR